jgi:hypothetical protein
MIGSRIVVPALRSALAPWTLTSAAAGAYYARVCMKALDDSFLRM